MPSSRWRRRSPEERVVVERIAAPLGVDSFPPVEIRRLAYPDLPQVMAVERRVFPTPWSLAMFVLELSKQSGISLAATVPEATGDPRLVGYLTCPASHPPRPLMTL